jgi:hypothetical protein
MDHMADAKLGSRQVQLVLGHTELRPAIKVMRLVLTTNEVLIGLAHIVALYNRSSTLCHIH